MKNSLSPLSVCCTRGIASLIACLCLTGCFGFLKPAASTARRFVLTPLAVRNVNASTAGALAIGVGQVKVPAYLFDSSLAVRKGTNEIDYLPSALWAERLDSGFQRVLAANLGALLPTDQVRLSAWRSDEVMAEVYVAVQQFDVDTKGHAVLIGWWRILSPGGEKVLKNGQARFEGHGPAPDVDPPGAVNTLSQLAADFSRQLADEIKQAKSHNQ